MFIDKTCENCAVLEVSMNEKLITQHNKVKTFSHREQITLLIVKKKHKAIACYSNTV